MLLVLHAAVATLLLLVTASPSSSERLCGGPDGRMEIRYTPQRLEELRNCTRVVGALVIALMNKAKRHEYELYSFPELTEITDYLIIYGLGELTSVDLLFPNLRVIRGVKLFSQYSLVLFRTRDLTTIGLRHLHIGRGGIKVEDCSNLCYIRTVNWTAIGATQVDLRDVGTDCDTCPMQCNGFCWDQLHCQKTTPENCHYECLGCHKPNSSRDCIVCRNFLDEGNCVAECPSDKYIHRSQTCLTAEKCKNFPIGKGWFTWQPTNNATKECLNECPAKYSLDESQGPGCHFCGELCVRVCDARTVSSVAALEELRGCTHINGSLELWLSNPNLENDIEPNLEHIREISGYLKVFRSNVVKSLRFFKGLRRIGGADSREPYSLYVLENPNLQQLWDFSAMPSFTIAKGTMGFFNNPQLCVEEIETLARIAGVVIKDEDMVKFRNSNGDTAPCNIQNLDIKVEMIDARNVTLTWPKIESPNDTIVGYTVYYSLTPNDTTDLTEFSSKDVCDDNKWYSTFSTNNSLNLTGLKPFSRYGYYIKTYRTSSKTGDQTPIYYFKTVSEDPSEPIDFVASAVNATSIFLQWDPPSEPNGIVDFYNVTVLLEKDYEPTVAQRDYCKFPHGVLPDDMGEDDQPWRSDNSNLTLTDTQTSENNCTCNENTQKEKFDDIVRILKNDGVCLSDSPDVDSCKNYMYLSSEAEFTEQIAEETEYETSSDKKADNSRVKRDFFDNDHDQKQFYRGFAHTVSVPGNTTNTTITGLSHFSLYIFFLRACNRVAPNENASCSAVQMSFVRTNRSESGDAIDHVNVTTVQSNATITWNEPKKVNSILVSYEIEHQRTDLEHPKPVTNCLTHSNFLKAHRLYRLTNLETGKYSLRVRATSLAGPANYTSSYHFEILSPSNQYLYFLFMLIPLSIMASFAVYLWYRKKYYFDNIHLITSINPDYAGLTYVEDHWELDRADVEILRDIGAGSFGMVSEGLIKSRNYRCAVKRINDDATVSQRDEFLKEGAAMKSFNEAHHVVKLLGIVSRGTPPLVVMELMERGDLKSFLRRCRQPSQTLTTNEMYRMCIEIADGMAYLCAKKFVHRDLAARNCMVSADRTVKIGDFGMTRDIYVNDYYRKELEGMLPVRWMAPESLVDGVFSSDSDVWSYGVVLWEMATLAEQPYQGLSNGQVLQHISRGGVLDRPNECTDVIYEVMTACWEWRPKDRPTFMAIVDKLLSHVGEDFASVSFCYSKQGRDYSHSCGPRPNNLPATRSLIPAGPLKGHDLGGDEEEAEGDDHREPFIRYDANEEQVGLCIGKPSPTSSMRPNKFRPFSSQRYLRDEPLTPYGKDRAPIATRDSSDES